MNEGGPPASVATPGECDPERAGDLSIIVQGPLTERNLFETATNVRHWRALFPAAQLVLALSGTTILVSGEDGHGGELLDPGLVAPFAPDSQMRAALASIRRDCDALVMARAALPLPPIKADTGLPNNINLQIAAAQAGLARVDGRYVLRVRSDLIFLDRGFLDQYAAAADRPRGEAAVLRRRVLISWLYTLNPFAEERLPLHFSDWFHFGLRDDVARLWDVPDMTLPDAVFYQAHSHPSHSNPAERLFHTRLADEQHLATHSLCRDQAEPRLLRHNDPGPAVHGIRVLIDNFVLCDMKAAHCVFPKYGEEFYNHRKLTACITPDDWHLLAALRHVDPRIVLSGKIQQAREPSHHEYRQGFPRCLAASRFVSETGTLSRGVIATQGDGVVARGPRMRLPPDRYLARLEIGPVGGDGTLRLTATTDDGNTVIGEASFDAPAGPCTLVMPFEVTGYRMGSVQIVCRSEGLDRVTIHGLSIDQALPAPGDRPFPRFATLLATDSDAGGATLSAVIAVRPGRYVAAFDLPVPTGGGGVTLRSTTGDGARVIASRHLGGEQGGEDRCELSFDVTDADLQSVILDCAGDRLPERIGLVVAQRDWHRAEQAFPRFYDAQSLHVANGTACKDRIRSDGRNGVLCFGPYADLAAGEYAAHVHLGGAWPKSLSVAVTGEVGTRQIAVARFDRPGAGGLVTVPFHVGPDGLAGVEVVCSAHRPGDLFVTGVTLDTV